MRREDKDKIIGILSLSLFTGLFFFFKYYTKTLPLYYIGIGAFLIYMFIMVPMLCDYYFRSKGVDSGLVKYIPILNQISMFKPVTGILFACSWIVTVFTYALSFLPVDLYLNFMSEPNALNMPYRLLLFSIGFLIVSEVVSGIAFSQILLDIRYMTYNMTGRRLGKVGYIHIVILCLPLFRCISILYLIDRLRALVIYNNFIDGEVNSKNILVEEEE